MRSREMLPTLVVFPESREWAEKKEPGTHCLLMYPHFPQNFREFGNFHKICSITLASVRHVNFYRMKDSNLGLLNHWLCKIKSFHQQTKGPFPCNMPIYLCCSLCGYPLEWQKWDNWRQVHAMYEAFSTTMPSLRRDPAWGSTCVYGHVSSAPMPELHAVAYNLAVGGFDQYWGSISISFHWITGSANIVFPSSWTK